MILVVLPDGPPNTRGPLEVLVGPFHRRFGLSWEYILAIVEFYSRDYLFTRMCFFSRNRPPEELDNKRSSARRGEFDSSTPGVIGVLLG